MHTAVGQGPRTSQMWEKKPDNWSKGNKDPEELTCISGLTPSSLPPLIKDTHALSHQVYISALILS